MLIMIEILGLLCWVVCVSADITVYSRKTHHQLAIEFEDIPGRFGGFIPSEALMAFLVYADPPDACKTIAPAPNSSIPNFTGRWAVLIRRFGCDFEKKVRQAQAAHYDIVIIHNNSSELVPMSVTNKEGISVVAVFVSENTGRYLYDNYLWTKGFYIMVDDSSPFDINSHLLLPFAIVVGICFCTMLGFMIIKCIKDHRRARRHRLPSSSLRKIPIAKFRKGDPYETCAICLEDFIEEEKLRILPCSHAYHCKCVDPWLTRNRRVCPVCKRKVFAADEVRTNMTDSDTDSEVDDRTPLVRSSGNITQGGTFTSSLLNSALRRPGSLRRYSASDAEAVTAGPSNSAPSIQHSSDAVVVADVNHVVKAADEAPNPFEDV